MDVTMISTTENRLLLVQTPTRNFKIQNSTDVLFGYCVRFELQIHVGIVFLSVIKRLDKASKEHTLQHD